MTKRGVRNKKTAPKVMNWTVIWNQFEEWIAPFEKPDSRPYPDWPHQRRRIQELVDQRLEVILKAHNKGE